jgi:hypothetical protein
MRPKMVIGLGKPRSYNSRRAPSRDFQFSMVWVTSMSRRIVGNILVTGAAGQI